MYESLHAIAARSERQISADAHDLFSKLPEGTIPPTIYARFGAWLRERTGESDAFTEGAAPADAEAFRMAIDFPFV